MKLKQITLIEACRSMDSGNVYIMFSMKDGISEDLIKAAEGYFIEAEEETQESYPAAEVEPIHPVGSFTWEDQWAEETEQPTEKPKTKSKIDVGKICALYRASWSVAKIADEMGCSQPSVRTVLKREGLKS